VLCQRNASGLWNLSILWNVGLNFKLSEIGLGISHLKFEYNEANQGRQCLASGMKEWDGMFLGRLIGC